MGGTLIHLNRSKAFDRIDYHYLEAVPGAASLGPGFRGWIKTIYNGIRSSVQVNWYLSESFDIK